MRPGTQSFWRGERTFPGYSGTPGKTCWSGGDFASDSKTVVLLERRSPELIRDLRERLQIGRRGQPEHCRAAFLDERKQPLERHRRRRERLRQSHSVALLVLFRTPPGGMHVPEVRRRAFEEL